MRARVFGHGLDVLQHHPGAGGLDLADHRVGREIDAGNLVGLLVQLEAAGIVFETVAVERRRELRQGVEREERVTGEVVADAKRRAGEGARCLAVDLDEAHGGGSLLS